MDSIQIKDKQFTVSIKEQDIQKEVIRVANEINRDWQIRTHYSSAC